MRRLPLAAIFTLALILPACGEKDESDRGTPAPAPATSNGASEVGGSGDGRDGRDPDRDATGSDPAPVDTQGQGRRAAERVLRAYYEALDARDGAEVCRLLAPGVVEELRPPRERSGCAATLDASIGYGDPRGLPEFQGVSVAQVAGIEASADRARATTTVVTRFADRTEPSIEDDIVYMEARGASYLIAKPSAALYRAVGAEPPLRSVAPPG